MWFKIGVASDGESNVDMLQEIPKTGDPSGQVIVDGGVGGGPTAPTLADGMPPRPVVDVNQAIQQVREASGMSTYIQPQIQNAGGETTMGATVVIPGQIEPVVPLQDTIVREPQINTNPDGSLNIQTVNIPADHVDAPVSPENTITYEPVIATDANGNLDPNSTIGVRGDHVDPVIPSEDRVKKPWGNGRIPRNAQVSSAPEVGVQEPQSAPIPEGDMPPAAGDMTAAPAGVENQVVDSSVGIAAPSAEETVVSVEESAQPAMEVGAEDSTTAQIDSGIDTNGAGVTGEEVVIPGDSAPEIVSATPDQVQTDGDQTPAGELTGSEEIVSLVLDGEAVEDSTVAPEAQAVLSDDANPVETPAQADEGVVDTNVEVAVNASDAPVSEEGGQDGNGEEVSAASAAEVTDLLSDRVVEDVIKPIEDIMSINLSDEVDRLSQLDADKRQTEIKLLIQKGIRAKLKKDGNENLADAFDSMDDLAAKISAAQMVLEFMTATSQVVEENSKTVSDVQGEANTSEDLADAPSAPQVV